MAATLQKYFRQVEDGVREIADHCSLSRPNIAGLSAARVRLSRASAARTRYINGVIIPTLSEDADPAFKVELDSAQRAFGVERLKSSEHVAKWSSQTIEADWEGYQKASLGIRKMMVEQIDKERAMLIPRLQKYWR